MYYHPLQAFYNSDKFRIARYFRGVHVLLRSLLFAVSTKNKTD